MDDSLTIEHVRMWGADGGIDDLRTGGTSASCSLDDIAETLESLDLPQNKSDPLLQKVDQVLMMLAKDKPCQGINALEQLAHKIVTWAGKFMPASEAEALLVCIAALIAALSAENPAC